MSAVWYKAFASGFSDSCSLLRFHISNPLSRLDNGTPDFLPFSLEKVQRPYIIPILDNICCYNVFAVHFDLYVMLRLQLGVMHMVILHMHESSIRIGLAVIFPSLKAGCMPVVDCLPFQKPPEQLQIFLITAFRFPRSWTKTVYCSLQIFSRNRQISWRSCVLVVSVRWKRCMYSWFRKETASCIFWNIVVSHFPTDFFQTKVYLFAQAFGIYPMSIQSIPRL